MDEVINKPVGPVTTLAPTGIEVTKPTPTLAAAPKPVAPVTPAPVSTPIPPSTIPQSGPNSGAVPDHAFTAGAMVDVPDSKVPAKVTHITNGPNGAVYFVDGGDPKGYPADKLKTIWREKQVQYNPPPIARTAVGKTIASISANHNASVLVIDLTFSDGSHHYIKAKQGVVEHGGTADWETGTERESHQGGVWKVPSTLSTSQPGTPTR